MEKVGYCILILATIAWIIAGICGIFQNIWIGIIGIDTMFGLGLLFLKTLNDRIKSRREDRYSRDVKK